jgi:hypothetical protein
MVAVVDLNNSQTSTINGQFQKYGTSLARATRVGEYMDTSSGRHCVEATIALASLPTVSSTNVQIIDDSVTIPNGAFIEEITVLVTKETAGSTANFNLGLVDQDRSTEIDFDGFLAAADAFNGGTDLGTLTQYIVGTTEAGALIGTKITNTGLLVAWADTADFTAGVIKVRIFYSFPASADL